MKRIKSILSSVVDFADDILWTVLELLAWAIENHPFITAVIVGIIGGAIGTWLALSTIGL